MPKDLEALLVRLRARANILNSSTDELNQRIAAVEERVRATKAGVEVWVDEPAGPEHPWALGWSRKPDRSWGFVVLLSGERMALLAAPRAVRLEAVKHLHRVIEAAICRADEMVQEVGEVLTSLEE
jgi:hypothetical protein